MIALLATAIIVGAKYRNRTVLNYASIATASAAAESAINVAIASLMSGPPDRIANFPLNCQLPTGEHATVLVEAESGKVDLNTASATTLTKLFTSLSANQRLGIQISAGILSKRKAGAAGKSGIGVEKNAQPAPAGFRTIMELDQIEGVSARLFRNALPFVTVSSRLAEPDPESSSEDLRNLIHLERKRTEQGVKPVAEANVTIRAEISSPNGAKFIREALISFAAENDRPFVIREWRRGDIRSRGQLLHRNQGYGSCILLGTVDRRGSDS